MVASLFLPKSSNFCSYCPSASNRSSSLRWHVRTSVASYRISSTSSSNRGCRRRSIHFCEHLGLHVDILIWWLACSSNCGCDASPSTCASIVPFRIVFQSRIFSFVISPAVWNTKCLSYSMNRLQYTRFSVRSWCASTSFLIWWFAWHARSLETESQNMTPQ